MSGTHQQIMDRSNPFDSTWPRIRRMLGSAFLCTVVLLMPGSPAAATDVDRDGLRDAFERRYGVTQPSLADSDRDGVVDSAEDNDGDRLGNLGEQRFGTDPGRRDSDRDGRADGAEDSDRDGIRNDLEQDRRRLPDGLRPTLADAPFDMPPRLGQCPGGATPSAVSPCPAGDTTSDTSVVLFGDSHAAQWFAALVGAGTRAGWQVYATAMGNCPSVFVTTKAEYLEDQGRSCQRWRTDVLAWLAANPPDLVILSNLGGYTFVDADGREVSDADRDAVWSQGLRRMLGSLPDSSRVAVLGETPNPRLDPVSCLEGHRLDMSACVARRAEALHADRDALDRSVATAAGAVFGSLSGKICSYDPCPVVQGRILIWRDQGHLTATFSRQLAPAMQAFVAKALASRMAAAGR